MGDESWGRTDKQALYSLHLFYVDLICAETEYVSRQMSTFSFMNIANEYFWTVKRNIIFYDRGWQAMVRDDA